MQKGNAKRTDKIMINDGKVQGKMQPTTPLESLVSHIQDHELAASLNIREMNQDEMDLRTRRQFHIARMKRQASAETKSTGYSSHFGVTVPKRKKIKQAIKVKIPYVRREEARSVEETRRNHSLEIKCTKNKIVVRNFRKDPTFIPD